MIPPGEEVELICLGDSAHIQDLGLRMERRGAKIRTTLSAISRSKDLEEAKRQGIIGVRIMKGTIKPESLETSHNLRTVHRAAIHPGLPSPQPEVSATDQTLVVKVVSNLTVEVAKLSEQLKAMEKTLVERTAALVGETWGEKTAVAVASAVRDALKEIRFDRVTSVSVESGSRPLIETPSEERFIPSGIVPVESKDIEIKKSVSESGGVDEAGEALRNARNRQRSENNG